MLIFLIDNLSDRLMCGNFCFKKNVSNETNWLMFVKLDKQKKLF